MKPFKKAIYTSSAKGAILLRQRSFLTSPEKLSYFANEAYIRWQSIEYHWRELDNDKNRREEQGHN